MLFNDGTNAPPVVWLQKIWREKLLTVLLKHHGKQLYM